VVRQLELLLQQNLTYEETDLRQRLIKTHYYTCKDYYSQQELHILEAFTYFSFYRPKIDSTTDGFATELS